MFCWFCTILKSSKKKKEKKTMQNKTSETARHFWAVILKKQKVFRPSSPLFGSSGPLYFEWAFQNPALNNAPETSPECKTIAQFETQHEWKISLTQDAQIACNSFDVASNKLCEHSDLQQYPLFAWCLPQSAPHPVWMRPKGSAWKNRFELSRDHCTRKRQSIQTLHLVTKCTWKLYAS